MNLEHIQTSEGGYAQPIISDEGVLFFPVYDVDSGVIGFRVEHPDHPIRYVLLNPSGGTDTGVYLENAGPNMRLINSKCYINIWDDV